MSGISHIGDNGAPSVINVATDQMGMDTDTADIESVTMRKIFWRLVPILSLGYLFCALDRFNIAFAALTMNKELGFTAAQYGLGAGAFFWSYVLFAVPGNLILKRIGARRWITIVMLVWGICTAGAALISSITTFVIARFLLGLAESGFFPGITYLVTQWFPAGHRGRAMGIIYAFGAGAGIIGGPIATHLLMLDGLLGLSGWQWLFIVEALPAILLALCCPVLLRNKPDEAAWLNEEERNWVNGQLAHECRSAGGGDLSIRHAITSPMVITFALIYFLVLMGLNAKEFFLPLILQETGFGLTTIGYIASLQALCGVAGMLVLSQSSDRTGERIWHLAIPCFLGGIGLAGVGLSLSLSPVIVVAGFCLCAFGLLGFLPVFWNLPSAYLSGSPAAAIAIAFISSIGNSAGFVAPQVIGLLRSSMRSYEVPLTLFGLLVIGSGMIVIAISGRYRRSSIDGAA